MLRRYLAILVAINNASTLINFLVSLILARLLTPRDVGIFSMSVVFVNIMHTFRDFGVTAYMLRDKDLNQGKIRSAYGLLIATSWCMAVLLFLMATPVANALRAQEVAEVMRVLSLGFLMIPFGAVTQTLLKRNLDANGQAIVLAVSTIVYGATCIGLAATGGGYMSMAWANLANIFASNIALAWLRPVGMPWLPSIRGWGAIVHFSSGAVLTNLATNLNNAVPDTLLGRKLSADAVGLYSRGNGLVELFSTAVMPAVNNASLPVLAKRFHEGKPIHEDLALGMAYLCVLAWPVLLVTSMHAHDIIQVLFGTQWTDAAAIVPLLCLSSAVRICFVLNTNTMIAIGRPFFAAAPVVIAIVFRIGLALLFAADDLMLFVGCFAAADILSSAFIAHTWVTRLDFPLKSLLRTLSNSALACIGVALSSPLIWLLPADWPPLLRVCCLGIVTVPAWYLGIHVTQHPLKKDITALISKVFLKLKH